MGKAKKNKKQAPDDQLVPRHVKLYFHGEAETPAERMAAIRQLRKGQILNYLLNNGPSSRVDIARALGFNLRTVSLLVTSLIRDEVVVEQPAKASHAMGRRPVPLELNASAACVMAIEVDRDFTRFALLDLQGQILVTDEYDSDFGDTPELQARWLIDTTRGFLNRHRNNRPPLAGGGFSFDGFVFRQHLSHSHASVTEPIRHALEEALKIPINADTNSRLIVIGEQRFGGARGARDALTINISDGLSLGGMVDGKVLEGTHNSAGELGHIPLGESGIPCYCGSSGCLENIVSSSGIRRLMKKHNLNVPPNTPAFKALLQQSGRNETAMHILNEFHKHLALAITIGSNLYDPEVVVIAGSVSPDLEPYHDNLRKHIQKLSVPFIMEKISIKYSLLGKDAVLLGTGGQILNQIYSASHVDAESLL